MHVFSFPTTPTEATQALFAEEAHKLVSQYSDNANACSRHEDTALFIACNKGHLPLVKYLVETGGANIEAKTTNGWTALLTATEMGHLHVVQYLVDLGHANVNAAKSDGLTAFILAVIHCLAEGGEASFNAGGNRLAIVKYLVQTGQVNVEARDEKGRTALHYACSFRRLHMVQYLAGFANVHVLTSNGQSALHVVCGGNEVPMDLVRYLAETSQVDLHLTDSSGRTALHVASQRWKKRVVMYIIQRYPVFKLYC